MKIVEAQQTDIDTWLQLRKELWSHHSEQSLREEIDDILADHDHWGFIGYADGGDQEENKNETPIGFIELSIHERAPGSHGKKVLYLEGWYVREKFRGKGYGQQFLEFAKHRASDLGFEYLASDTTSNYPGSYEAHTKLGFKEVKRVFHFVMEV